MPTCNPRFPLEIIDEADMPEGTDRAIRRLLCECFPADADAFARSRAWHDSAPAFSLVYREGDAVAGHVGMVVREVACAGRSIAVAGVQNMCVAPHRRGSGLSAELMARGLEEAKRRGIAFGLLFCVPELERLYRRLGWLTSHRPVTMLDEIGRVMPIPEKNIPMIAELGDESFPPGVIYLKGPDW